MSQAMTIEREEYQIYAALIDATHVHTDASIGLIVLLDHTDIAPTYDGRSTLNLVKKRAPALLPDTLDDFESKNATPCALDYTFDLTVEYLLIGDEVKSMAFASKTGWADFYAKYPRSQGITWVSRVGFNREHDQALVYLANRRHTLMGSGEYLLLANDRGQWRPRGLVRAWIS